MKKQKKRPFQISYLNRALGLAANFPSMSPENFKKYMAGFRLNAKEVKEDLGFANGINKVPIDTPSTVDMRNRVKGREMFENYVGCCRSLILGEWDRYRRVYIVGGETLRYIVDSFPVDKLQINLADIIKQECKEPIYIDMRENDTVKGCFLGITALESDAVSAGVEGLRVSEDRPLMLGSLIYQDKAMIFVHLCTRITVAEYFDRAEFTPEQRLVMHVLVYIAYMRTRRDAMGRVFIPKNVQGGDAYVVNPVAGRAFFSELENPSGWIAQGICAWVGYLYRENMVKDYTELLEQNKKLDGVVFQAEKSEQQMDAMRYLCWKSALEWEKYRTVYQYDKETEDRLITEHLMEVTLQGFDPGLLQFLPQNTIVLYQKTDRIVALITTCKIAEYGRKGLFILLCSDYRMAATVLPATRVGAFGKYKANATEDMENLRALCILRHILLVLQNKAAKKAMKDAAQAGRPDEVRLVPYAWPQAAERIPAEDRGEAPLYRNGLPIEDIPLQLFEVTGRTVKRMRQEEKKVRYGWKMAPHVRRPHPHRYWVGRGQDRHLEVRWLERMHIHKDQEVKTTTIHDVKIGGKRRE